MGQYGYQSIQASVMDISAVVTSLPIGPALGNERVYNGVTYKLVYNAGNSQAIPGRYLSPVPLDGGAYSVTITTTSDANHHLGAVVVHHATATTGTYFWGATKGVVPMAPSAIVSAGVVMMCGLSGVITSGPSLPTERVGNQPAILCITSGGTAGVTTGTYLVNFS